MMNVRAAQREALLRLLAWGMPKGGSHTITSTAAATYHMYIRPILGGGTAGYTDLTIATDPNKIWLVENVSFIQNDVAARAIILKHNSESEVILDYQDAAASTYYTFAEVLNRENPMIVGVNSVLHLEVQNLDNTKILQTHWVYREISDVENIIKGI